MKVLVIPSWYPNGTDKLMGIYHKEFCEAISKKIDVDMLYIDRQRLNSPIKYLFMKKKEIIKEKGYNVYIKKMLDVHKISADYQLKKYTQKLEELYLEYLKNNAKPDVIHAEVTIPAGYAACELGEKYHIPVVVTEHASYFKRFFIGNNTKYGKYVLEHSYFTTVSKYMQKIILDMGYKCEVIPNLVDTTSFDIKRKKINDLKLITVSALREGKRIDDIIEALKLIKEENKNIKASLAIIGDGFKENYYKDRCKELGMQDDVDFLGRKTKEEIVQILKNYNIFVIASEKETFCIPGIEALASGMPVVATKCLGPEEYINDKCGKLVSVGNIKEIKEAIIEVYNNLDKYDIKELKKQASKYSSDTISNLAIKIYKEISKN